MIGRVAVCARGIAGVITHMKLDRQGRPVYHGKRIDNGKPWQSLRPSAKELSSIVPGTTPLK